eukprot:CAMPEP_0198736874 /NCGR_PEP_ID=MMETSP1475-20131203/67578_1 /TAXON_ID= ORGANISM="Unidentified sp., Strain CCMP1999" /NCGR_SAMPLE_ID=MMETSP1475 /ASSEMBLY_ACC=CAM_ASM_001111 /LENGTH=1175 /DNA_ID=CAMNT_0044500727 /DNA_START=134 /DNA_END=3661 /DNA_ORIENTATION=-
MGVCAGFIPAMGAFGRERRRVSVTKPHRASPSLLRMSSNSGEKEPSSVNDDSYWADLAKDIYGDDGEKPVRDAKENEEGPKFVYPEGVDPKSFFESSEDSQSAWGTWNSALQKEAAQDQDEVEMRDPKKETDFWRGAAKAISSDVSTSSSESSASATGSPGPESSASATGSPGPESNISAVGSSGSDSEPSTVSSADLETTTSASDSAKSVQKKDRQGGFFQAAKSIFSMAQSAVQAALSEDSYRPETVKSSKTERSEKQQIVDSGKEQAKEQQVVNFDKKEQPEKQQIVDSDEKEQSEEQQVVNFDEKEQPEEQQVVDSDKKEQPEEQQIVDSDEKEQPEEQQVVNFDKEEQPEEQQVVNFDKEEQPEEQQVVNFDKEEQPEEQQVVNFDKEEQPEEQQVVNFDKEEQPEEQQVVNFDKEEQPEEQQVVDSDKKEQPEEQQEEQQIVDSDEKEQPDEQQVVNFDKEEQPEEQQVVNFDKEEQPEEQQIVDSDEEQPEEQQVMNFDEKEQPEEQQEEQQIVDSDKKEQPEEQQVVNFDERERIEDKNVTGELTDDKLDAIKAGISSAMPSNEAKNSASKKDASDDVGLGDSGYWADLAKDVVPSEASSEPAPVEESSGPKWTYPEDVDPNDFFNQSEDDKAAWGTWNSAIEKESTQELEMRDPAKEKEFWRGAAQELTNETTSQSGKDSKKSEKEMPQTSETPEMPVIPNDPTEVWKAAREITTETQAFQQALREEVQNYNPADEKQPYKNIAKDLLADLQERKELNEKLKAEQNENMEDSKVSVNDWDPDRDWRRFDDVDAELERQRQALENASKWREEMAGSEADSSVAPAPNTGAAPTSPIRFTDENGKLLSREEVDMLASEGAVFVDENGNPVDMSGSLLDSAESSDESVSNDDEPASVGDEPVDTDKPVEPISFETTPSGAPQGAAPTIKRRFKSSTYGGDRGGIEQDLQALESEGVGLRDPKADTDFWRGTAKELTNSDGTTDGADSEGAKTDVTGKESASQEEDDKSAWDAWSNARQGWENDLDNMSERDPKKEVDMWRGAAQELTGGSSSSAPAKKDWGSGMEGGSFSSAWESWRESSPVQPTNKDQWWSNRSDNVKGRTNSDVASSSDPGFWSGIAKDMKPDEEKASEQAGDGDKKDLGESINMWLDFAKSVKIEDDSSSSKDEKE